MAEKKFEDQAASAEWWRVEFHSFAAVHPDGMNGWLKEHPDWEPLTIDQHGFFVKKKVSE